MLLLHQFPCSILTSPFFTDDTTTYSYSYACSFPSDGDFQSWIAYLLFAPCPQRSLLAILNIAFLLFQSFRLLLLLRRRRRHLTPVSPTAADTSSGGKRRWSLIYFLTLSSAAALAVISLALTFALLWELLQPADDGSTIAASIFIRETIFSAVDAAAYIAALALLLQERTRPRALHAMALRLWWFASFLLSVLQFLTSVYRLAQKGDAADANALWPLDACALARFPILLFLVAAAIDGGTTGVWRRRKPPAAAAAADSRSGLSEALLLRQDEGGGGGGGSGSLGGVEEASVFSKATFAWLTPVLAAGSKRTLEVADVPALPTRDSAESMYEQLRSKWPTDSAHPRPLRAALIRRFWPQLLLTGSLQLIRTFVIYVGPLLISSFTTYASSDHSSPFDGYALVILLLAGKIIELFSYHHYNFQCYRLGNNVRTSVVTCLYRKSLRLSSAARESHGVGQITNYMVVDAQMLSDACLQLHLAWSLPLQVVIALLLLYMVMGVSAVAGIATMACITYIMYAISEKQKLFYGMLMKARDVRMKMITEILAYMKVIKLQAWEERFEEKMEGCRKEERGFLNRLVFATAGSVFTLWNTLPVVSMLTYAIAVLTDPTVTTTKVFTAAAVFKIVQEPMRNIPQAVFTISQMVVCLERLDGYMKSGEVEGGAVERAEEEAVVVEEGRFRAAEAAEEEAAEAAGLKEINLRVRKGWLVAVVGMVGSGKSSLLAALLGEMRKVSGRAKVCRNVAYVAQTAWIQNGSIKDNILFGSEWEEKRYKEVIGACALEPDFASMDSGDETEIGEKGINLSGGQKQRIQLARAIYHPCADLYLLDDIFSAVDAHTGSHVFNQCILGLLHGKTILLVTHQVEFLSRADLVVVMKNGRIAQSGSYDDILSVGTDFAALVAAHRQSLALVDTRPTSSAYSTSTNHDLNHITINNKSPSSASSAEQLPSTDSFSESAAAAALLSSKLIQDEQRETGRVSWKIYWLYLTKVYGWTMAAALLLNQSVWQASLLASDYWLADEVPQNSSQTINKQRFIIVYVLLNLVAIVGILVRVILVSKFGLATAHLFFRDMLHSIFRAPMSFFDTTPSGRILSRLSGDQSNLDFLLHFFIGGCISTYFSALGVIIVVSISAWPILLMIIPLSWLYFFCQKFYITSSREMTRLDSVTKAPVIYHFSETVAGIETIRCFRKQEEFIQKNLERVNTNMKMDFHNLTANEWLGLRLEAIGTVILCTTAFLFVVLPKSLINTDTVALALSYALSLNSTLYATVLLSCTIENKMVSVERIRQFTVIPQEAARHIPDSQPSADWPNRGQIISKRLKLRYRPSTPLILKGVSFCIEGGEKIGVVGRTGSGKSTLILALFRLVEASAGQILIDKIDISTIGVVDLRNRLGVIPQEPVLFQGTIRTNLDPCELYSDDEIWQTLEKCQLAHVIKDKPEKLEVSVTEYGSNWSMGQRQLLCFGRALLKHSKILFLDEATASVDTQTDIVIQQIIREEFRESTVMSIAHRIPSVMDSDRVLVMDSGRVKEFENPSSLLQKESLFASLVHEYSSRAAH